ncbi:MAG TPA: RsmE family RNA methyltransferase [Dehalococcoidia bacterium]|nr:RsmE family RNA methyltransferase [Dehalococcoidia bacterium]
MDDASVLEGRELGGSIAIRGASVHRLGRVLRLRRGDDLEVVHEGSGCVFRVELQRLTSDVVEAEVLEAREIMEDAPPPLWLCPSIVRAPRFDLLVEKTTELGVFGIRPVRATRSLAQSQGRERSARWKRLVTEASEQCRRERRPLVEDHVELLDLVGGSPEPGGLRLFASERERTRWIPDLFREQGLPTSVELLVGPEGGFTEAEAEAAAANAWQPVSLGPRPLRAETASIVATALVQEALREARSR